MSSFWTILRTPRNAGLSMLPRRAGNQDLDAAVLPSVRVEVGRRDGHVEQVGKAVDEALGSDCVTCGLRRRPNPEYSWTAR